MEGVCLTKLFTCTNGETPYFATIISERAAFCQYHGRDNIVVVLACPRLHGGFRQTNGRNTLMHGAVSPVDETAMLSRPPSYAWTHAMHRTGETHAMDSANPIGETRADMQCSGAFLLQCIACMHAVF